ncbi:MAG: hypothetical protein U0L05_01675 [Schaedlerella sp.]|nr:hypothetical protein [Schaedlerella sp.]
MEFVLELKEEIVTKKMEIVMRFMLTMFLTIVLALNVCAYEYVQVKALNVEFLKKGAKKQMPLTGLTENMLAKAKEEILKNSEKAASKETPIELTMAAEKEVVVESILKENTEIQSLEMMEVPEISKNEVIVEFEMSENITGEESEILQNATNEKSEILENVANVESETLENVVETESENMSEMMSVEDIVSASPFLIDEAGMIYGYQPILSESSAACLELPKEGCFGIRRGTFAGCTEYISEIIIPSNITCIEDGALTELTSLEWITVKEDNLTYKAVDGVLFDYSKTTLQAYPPARIGAYFIPANVLSVSANAFLNSNLFMIDLRDCGLSANCLLNISENCSIIE